MSDGLWLHKIDIVTIFSLKLKRKKKCVWQIAGGHPCSSDRSRPGHSHHQLQCKALSELQWVSHKTQAMWDGCLHSGEGQSEGCYDEGPRGCGCFFPSCCNPFSLTVLQFIGRSLKALKTTTYSPHKQGLKVFIWVQVIFISYIQCVGIQIIAKAK